MAAAKTAEGDIVAGKIDVTKLTSQSVRALANENH
jgi:hypothetical protein